MKVVPHCNLQHYADQAAGARQNRAFDKSRAAKMLDRFYTLEMCMDTNGA